MFQSTPPAWGATLPKFPSASRPMRFNPRPPRGGRLPHLHGFLGDHVVSIHAPRVGGDLRGVDLSPDGLLFQSTPPAWGATRFAPHAFDGNCVSIHAPRVGGDGA